MAMTDEQRNRVLKGALLYGGLGFGAGALSDVVKRRKAEYQDEPLGLVQSRTAPTTSAVLRGLLYSVPAAALGAGLSQYQLKSADVDAFEAGMAKVAEDAGMTKEALVPLVPLLGRLLLSGGARAGLGRAASAVGSRALPWVSRLGAKLMPGARAASAGGSALRTGAGKAFRGLNLAAGGYFGAEGLANAGRGGVQALRGVAQGDMGQVTRGLGSGALGLGQTALAVTGLGSLPRLKMLSRLAPATGAKYTQFINNPTTKKMLSPISSRLGLTGGKAFATDIGGDIGGYYMIGRGQNALNPQARPVGGVPTPLQRRRNYQQRNLALLQELRRSRGY